MKRHLQILRTSLFARLALVLLAIMALLGSLLLLLSQRMSEYYSQQVLQQLNQPVADYVVQQHPLINTRSELDQAALERLASHAMVLNPALEIYVLDAQGHILGDSLPAGQVQQSQVRLEPLQTYLQALETSAANPEWPLLGDNPSDPTQQRIFSVAAITDPDSNQIRGYVYAVIGGRLYQGLQEQAFEQYVFSLGGLLMLACILVTLLTGLLIFFAMTRRLSRLRAAVLRYDLLYPELSTLEQFPQPEAEHKRDEIDQLTRAFRQMATHIHQQFTRLQSLDKSRRELIANISHDLRTPLAAAQGYIETALISARDNPQTGQASLVQHLEVSIRQCQRLATLINELFELSRLQADSTHPNTESFSLLELAHDCMQEFQLRAESQQVSLEIRGEQQDCYVTADIAMIQRVLQNLMDNALRHTPCGGQVRLSIWTVESGTRIEVADTGCGISHHDIPYIFERYYRADRSSQTAPSASAGTGLGLAIVKRILDLHQARIDVESEPDKGTRFSFTLAT